MADPRVGRILDALQGVKRDGSPRSTLEGVTQPPPGLTDTVQGDVPLPLTPAWRRFIQQYGDGTPIVQGANLQTGGRIQLVADIKDLIGGSAGPNTSDPLNSIIGQRSEAGYPNAANKRANAVCLHFPFSNYRLKALQLTLDSRSSDPDNDYIKSQTWLFCRVLDDPTGWDQDEVQDGYLTELLAPAGTYLVRRASSDLPSVQTLAQLQSFHQDGFQIGSEGGFTRVRIDFDDAPVGGNNLGIFFLPGDEPDYVWQIAFWAVRI